MGEAADAYLVPTIITYEMIAAHGTGDGVSEDNLRKIKRGLAGAHDALGLAFEKGLRIASGSDLLGRMQPHKGREIALQARVMGAMNAIIAATRTNAALMRIEKEVGTLEEGKRADLIALDADPLQDPAIFADTNHVRMVMRGGNVVKDLDAPTLPSPRGGG